MGSAEMSFYTLDRLLGINSMDPRRTIQHSTFKCDIVKVDCFNNLIGEYPFKGYNCLGILIPLNLEDWKDYQIANFKIINVNPDGMVRMS